MGDTPTFKSLSDADVAALSQDKQNILSANKEAALSDAMVKTASFRPYQQNPYSSPYLSLADMNLPQSMRDIFKLCKYYRTFDPVIAGAVSSLSTFPITDIYMEDMESFKSDESKGIRESDQLKLYKRVFFSKMNIYQFLIEIGIDYNTFGNCFVIGEMEKGRDGEPEWKRVYRLDPNKVGIEQDVETGKSVFKYEVPDRTKNIVRKGPKNNPDYDKIPEVVRDAVRKNKMVLLKQESIYHFRRPSDSMGESEWGTPIIAHVLKLLMYRNVLRQAQEALAREHIVPFRIYYFERNASGYSADTTNYNESAKAFAAELMKASKDPNYKVISPVPVQALTVGGQGRALLLTPEIDQVQGEILAGMSVPKEFIFGGVSYSGSSISLKILENNFATYRLLLLDFMNNFLVKGMAKARGEWDEYEDDEKIISVKMTGLKMQDDVQQKQIVINLNGAGKIDDAYMLKTMGIDPDKMRESLKNEALAKVEMEHIVKLKQLEKGMELQLAQFDLQQKMQTRAQELGIQIPQDPAMMQGDPNAGMEQVDPNAQQPQMAQQEQVPQQAQQPEQQQQAQQPSSVELQSTAIKIAQLPKDQQEQLFQNMDPKMVAVMREYVSAAAESLGLDQDDKETQSGIDMREMPNQRPPRRDSIK